MLYSDGKQNWFQLESEYSHPIFDTFLTPPCTFLLLSTTSLNGFTVLLKILITSVDSAQNNKKIVNTVEMFYYCRTF